jgi:hypothetical protein
MKRASIHVLATVFPLMLAGAAIAADPPAPPAPVSELVVVGGPQPKMLASFPADGAEVAAGVLAVKLTFDQPMTADGWSFGHSDAGEFPKCLARPRLLADQRTFVLLCTVVAHKTYAMEVNATPAFLGANGRAAKLSALRFSTNDTVVSDIHAALEQANLTDADEPIMTWKDDGAGVSHSPPPPAVPAAAPHP